MDTIEQNTQDAQPVRSEPESVRSAKHSRRAFLFKLSQRSGGSRDGCPDHRLSSGAGGEEDFER